MAAPTPQEAAYQRAADIAAVLISNGLPVLGFGAAGGKLSVTFQLVNQAGTYTALLPEVEASSSAFTRLYEAMR